MSGRRLMRGQLDAIAETIAKAIYEADFIQAPYINNFPKQPWELLDRYNLAWYRNRGERVAQRLRETQVIG